MSLNVQACSSLVTFADEIVEPGARRLFARSAFAYGQDPDAAIAVAVTVAASLPVTAVRRPHPSVEALPPHAATSKPPATSKTTMSAARLVRLVFTSFHSSRA